MKLKDKITAYIERLREKHKLTYMDEDTYHEKWSFSVSSLRLISLLIAYTMLVVVVLLFMIKFTGLSILFTGNSDSEIVKKVQEQEQIIDSLYLLSTSNDLYLENLRRVLNDDSFIDSNDLHKSDTTFDNYLPSFQRSKEDSILRSKMENQSNIVPKTESGFSIDFFFAPVNGKISQSINVKKGHYGVDVVTASDEPIKVCLDGTIILSGWIPGEGNIIVVQHDNEILSIYKHCSVVLKDQGDKVLIGDPIGIVGNTGEFTSGPHLHFELWQNGKPLNPQEFISF